MVDKASITGAKAAVSVVAIPAVYYGEKLTVDVLEIVM